MLKIQDSVDQRESRFTESTQQKWPDRHPHGKPRTCDLCGAEARLYVCGGRCDEHSPAAMRKAVMT